jgi:pyruvate dehydrogenase kinase 2/3/4
MAAQPLSQMVSSAARLAVRAAAATAMGVKEGIRLADCVPRELVDDIFAHALKKQTGVSLKYMLDFGSNPIERQLVLSSQFLHKELPVRLAHRVAELENLPYGLSSKSSILKVRTGHCNCPTSMDQLRSSLGCIVSIG